jgi:hypothetical protein
MKKIITLLSAALIITSCSDCTKTDSSTEIPYVDTTYFKSYYHIHKLKIENHNYIMITGVNRMGLEHDPECPYCKAQEFPEHKLETTDF